MLSPIVSPDLKAFASELAWESGKIIKKYFRTGIGVMHKKDATPVTVADRETEECIVKMIRKKFPEHGIIGEEGGSINPESMWQWVIDPIDGTKSFVMGGFDFGTIIGLLYDGKPVLGAIHQPILGELFVGDNKTTTLNGKEIRVADTTNLHQAHLFTTDVMDLYNYHKDRKKLDELLFSVKHTRTWGNCYGYTLIAQGLGHIMLDPVLQLWDIVGLVPVIQGAGGVITDYYGNAPLSTMGLVATVPGLHHQVLSFIHQGKEGGLEKEITQKLSTLKGWSFSDGKIRKNFTFKDFNQAFSFMTRIALFAEKTDHHPDWTNVYNRVEVALNTHDAGPGITEKDFRLASFIDSIQ